MFAVERTANIKDNLYRRNAVKMPRNTITRRVWGFNFQASQQKVKKRLLCDLCVLSEAGGESMSIK